MKSLLCLLGRHRWKEYYPIIDWKTRHIMVRIECDRCGKLFRLISITIPLEVLKDTLKFAIKRHGFHQVIRGLPPKSRFVKKMWSGKGKIE